MHGRTTRIPAASALAALALAAPPSQTPSSVETSPHAPPLRFGMCTALSGPSADLGIEMRAGFEAAFAEQNRAGGVGGRPLELAVADDGYEPARTTPRMKELVADERVLAIAGNVGTPTAIASLPVAAEAGILFFAPFTGAGVLRKSPPERNVFNFRASYAEETAAMVAALLEHRGLACEEIALFTQRDAYGDAGYSGAIGAMRARGLADERAILHLRFERNTEAVESAAADLLALEHPPEAVIMVGTYKPCAKFVRILRESGCDPLFLNVSFVGSNSLARELGPDGDGVLITQVVPHFDADLPLVREYRRALTVLAPASEPSFGSLEGYVAGRILVRALERVRGEPTRSALIESFERLGALDLGLGTRLRLDASEHQACHAVWLTVIEGGRVRACEWSRLSP